MAHTVHGAHSIVMAKGERKREREKRVGDESFCVVDGYGDEYFRGMREREEEG